jgi:outer membrane protein assembly complex protein YaeT
VFGFLKRRWCVRLLRFHGAVVAVLVTGLFVVHTAPVRVLVLSWIAPKLSDAAGIPLRAQTLEYNLVKGWIQLGGISAGPDGSPLLEARRLSVRVPVWDLVRGEFSRAQIAAEGVSLHLERDAEGRWNWLLPTRELNESASLVNYFRSLHIGNLSLVLVDRSSGVSAELPQGDLDIYWQASRYRVAYRAVSKGRFQSADFAAPLDQVILNANLAADSLVLERLSIASGNSAVTVDHARLAMTGFDIAATGSAAIDTGQFVQSASGRLSSAFSISGTIGSPIADVRVTSDELTSGDYQLRQLSLAARYQGQKLEITDASTRVLGARVRLRGVMDVSGLQPRTRAHADIDGIAIDRLLAELGWSDAHSITGNAAIEATCVGIDWKKSRLSGRLRIATDAEVSFRAHMEGQQLALSIDSNGPAGIGATGTAQIGTIDRLLSGTLQGRIPSLSRANQLLGILNDTLRPETVDGALDWQLTLDGSVSRPKISFAAGSTNLSLPTVKAASLDLNGTYEDSGIRLDRLRVRSGEQEFFASGTVGAGSSLRIDGTVRGIAIGSLLAATTDVQSVSGGASGEFSLRGTPSSPQANARVAIASLLVYSQRLGPLEALVDFRDGTLSIERLHMEQPREEGVGKLEASGSVAIAERRFQFSATGSGLRIDESAVRGDVSFEAEGKGSFDDPEVKLTAQASQLATEAMPIGRLTAEVSYSGRRAVAVLKAPDLNATARTEVQAGGAYPINFEIYSTGTRVNASKYLDHTISGGFEGTVSGSATLGGPELQTASVSLRNMGIDVDGYKIESDGPVRADYQNGRLNIAPVSLTAPSARIQVSGNLPLDADQPDGKMSIAGTIRLEEVLKSLGMEGGGEVKVDAAILGSLRKWEPALNLTLENGRLAEKSVPVAAEQVTAEAHVADGVLRLEKLAGKLAGGDVRASATVPLNLIADRFGPPANDPSQPVRWSLETEHTQIRRSTQEDAGVTFSLRATGEAAQLSLADLKSVVELSELSVRGKRAEMKQTQPTRITIDHSVASLEAAELRGPNSTLRISGTSTLSADPSMDIHLAGETDASVLALVSPSLEASGQVTLDLHLKGTPQRPAGSGSVQLNRASLSIRDVPVSAEEVTGRVDVVDDRFVLSGLSGRLNGGKFSGEGEARLRDGKLVDVSIRAQGENVFLDYQGLRTSSNLNLALRSGERGLVLSGRVEIRDGLYRDVLDLGRNSKGAVATALPGGAMHDLDSIALEVDVVTAQPVEMDNNIGKLAAGGTIRVRGTVNNPTLGGEIRLEEGGRLYFGDRRYDIERGSVRLDGSSALDPQISLVATTHVSRVEIRLHLSGTAKNLTTTFTSDPPMSKNDIISVLLTGRTVAENRGVDLRKLEAYSLLSGAFNAGVGGSMGRKLGISQISIQPGMIAAESNPATRLTITEDFTRTLRLVYSMNLSDSADQIWIAEYDLTRHFQTRAVKESDNSYRAEVRHEIQFGGAGKAATNESKATTAKPKITQVSFQGGGPFDERQLARQLRVKPKQTYRPTTVRKGTERLLQFFQHKGYLESRVHMNREDHGEGVTLTAEISLGPLVSIGFTGDSIPRSVRKRIPQEWQSGQSDKQRIEAVRKVLTGHYGREGFLQVAAECKIQVSDGGIKQVAFDVQRGRHYSNVGLALESASSEHVQEILALIRKAKLEDAVYAEPRRVTDAIIGYYRQRGYLAAELGEPRLAIDEQAGTGQIVLDVTEGPAFRVGEIRFTGNEGLKESELLTNLQLSPGGPFEPARLSAAVAALRSKYESQGYRDVLIDYQLKQDAARGVLDVAFQIQEKDQQVVQSVAIEGNRQASEGFVRSQLVVSEGQPESLSQINQSVQNLSRTGAFRSVDIESRPSGDNAYAPQIGADLVVKVEEAKPFQVLYGGLYSTASGVGFIADFQNRNTLGSARVLGLRTRFDADLREVRLYLTQPVWGRTPIATTATTYVTRESIDKGVFTNKVGGSLQQDWAFRPKYLLSYGYRYEKARLTLQPADTRSVPPEPVATAPVYFTGSRDSRDSFLDASRGSFAALGSEMAPGWLGSDYGYLRWYGQYSKYFPLTNPLPVPFGEEPRRSRFVFATNIRMGLQTALNPEGIVLTDRFFAGGGTTIRGFAQDSVGPQSEGGQPIGGNAMMVLNNELRFPIFKLFDGVVFSDIGNVYPTISQFRLSDVRKSAGFGLRVRIPFVVLRFDYGVKLGRRPGESFGAFFFSIGQAF